MGSRSKVELVAAEVSGSEEKLPLPLKDTNLFLFVVAT